MASPSYGPASAAMDNLSGAYERLTQLRALLLSSSPTKHDTTEPTISLLDKSLRYLSAALYELQTSSPCRATTVHAGKNGTNHRNRTRKQIQSWTVVTSVPHVDGHQWRKYGQKPIIGAEFPRSYFKCTHSNDQGCPATKTVQKQEGDHANPPKYEVHYSMQHTCKSMEADSSPSVTHSSAVMDGGRSTITNMLHQPSTSGGRAASPEKLSPAQFPPEVADDYSLREQEHLMESTPHSSEIQGEENVGARRSSIQWSPLYELDFDWEWLMS